MSMAGMAIGSAPVQAAVAVDKGRAAKFETSLDISKSPYAALFQKSLILLTTWVFECTGSASFRALV